MDVKHQGVYQGPNGVNAEEPFPTAIYQQPVTVERKPFIPSKQDKLKDAGTARANIAADTRCPNGTLEGDFAERHKHQTVVQQHCDYFDTDHDGILWPSDTYNGCRKWGWNIFLSLLATFIINFNLSYPTVPGWLPDPCFRIYLNRVYKCKHGSDSMTYDNEGRFRSQNFEDIFAKYDRDNKGGLTVADVKDFIKGQSMVLDLFGINATILEWTAVYLLLWPEDGIMRKEDIRGIYDGSIFYKKADEYAIKTGKEPQPKVKKLK
ncbi:caleosin domain-containing protein [Exophiala viscosa]|uniref:Caleosin domain-containing protein n=1 Tax=Exophiala viscosa TaxID=2486360 RepID=A0AAN6DSI8_9EURO|nr:caleosin domain-containing protein [Exophiala viscosa]